MAMGSFNRKRQYKQENPLANAATMLGLLKQQNQSFGQVGDAIELQGQNQGRQKVAELMGTDEYSKLNPEQAQAAIMEATGGRRLGERGDDILSTSYDTKQKELNNQNKITAANLLHSRNLARDKANNVAEFGKNLDPVTGKPINATEALLGIKDQAVRIMKDLNNPNLSDEQKTERQAELEALQIKAEQTASGGKPSAGGEANIISNLFPGIKTTLAKTSKASYPKALGRSVEGLSRSDGDALKTKFDNDEFSVAKGDEIFGKDGKGTGKYKPDTYFDANGKPTTVREILGKGNKSEKKATSYESLTPEQKIKYDKAVLEKSKVNGAKRFGRG